MKFVEAVGEKSKEIFQKRDFALVGMSPFNSYFSQDNLNSLFEWFYLNFKSFKIFLPNEISYYTLKALEYDEEYIRKKVLKRDKHIKNKVAQALEGLVEKYQFSFSSNIFVEISKLKENPKYIKFLSLVRQHYKTNQMFYDGCRNASLEVLMNYDIDNNPLINDQQIDIAVEYILHEMPIYLNANEILDEVSCLYTYHTASNFIRELYDSELVSSNQGYLLATQ